MSANPGLYSAGGGRSIATIPRILFKGHSYVETGAQEQAGTFGVPEGVQGGTLSAVVNGFQGTITTTRGSTAVVVASTAFGVFGNGMKMHSPALALDTRALNATTIDKPARLSATAVFCCGGAYLETRFASKVAKAFHAEEMNLGVGGAIAAHGDPTTGGYATSIQYCPRNRSFWPYMPIAPVVVIFTGLNDLGFFLSLSRCIHGIRTQINWARNALTLEDSNFTFSTYTGVWTPQGSSVNSSGGQVSGCSAAVGAAAVHLATPADILPGQAMIMQFLLLADSAGTPTQGVIQFTNHATGQLLGTLDTRAAAIGIVDANQLEACGPRLVCGQGYNPGDTIDISAPNVTPGQIFFDCALVEAEIPPLVVLCKQPHLPVWPGGSGKGYDHYSTQVGLNDQRVDVFNAALDTLAAEYADGLVRTVDFSDMNAYQPFFSLVDGLHFNQRGNARAAAKIIQFIREAGLTEEQMQSYASNFVL